MATLSGLESVAKSIEVTKDSLGHAGNSDGYNWPAPLPLIAKLCIGLNPELNPLDALPDTIPNAVNEVLDFTEAPVPLVASRALAALSLAGQAHTDVKRA